MTEYAIEVFEENNATITLKVFGGQNKDYYFSLSTKAQGQNFRIHKKVLFSDDYEEEARQRLRNKRITNPTPKKLAVELKD